MKGGPSRPVAHTRFARVRAKLEAFEPAPGWRVWVFEFLLFGFKQGWACLFGGLMLGLLLATHWSYPAHAALARYDFLTIAALLIQIAMLATRLETLDEAKIIILFHIAGTAMELFKTSIGSWVYPEPAFLRIAGVPLFSGFMYASVGSYLARVWRIFEFRFSRYPPVRVTIAIALAIYVNFFAHHWLPDMRLGLFAALLLVFARTQVWFRVWHEYRRMPLLLGFLLVALFIYLAENLGTFAHAWIYPSQRHGWAIVSPMKLGAWYLLMYLSFVMVSMIDLPRAIDPFPLEQDR